MGRPSAIPVLPESPQILSARAGWEHDGSRRPPFARYPRPGQVSVWDFPRPPVMVACSQRLRVRSGNRLIAETKRGIRVLETAGAPTYYFPPDDIDADAITFGEMTSVSPVLPPMSRFTGPVSGSTRSLSGM